MNITHKLRADPDHLDRLIHENEAADFLGYSPRALQNWRLRGGGPPFIRVSSRSIRYSRRDLKAWVDSKRARSTSDVGGSDHA
ncbi:MAG: helix-turn-helix domain-containing protein [Pseudomonadota bacterium]